MSEATGWSESLQNFITPLTRVRVGPDIRNLFCMIRHWNQLECSVSKLANLRFSYVVFIAAITVSVAPSFAQAPKAVAKKTEQKSVSTIPKKAHQAKPTKSEPTKLTRAQLWALACPALLTEQNGDRHDLLWCKSATPENVAKKKHALEHWWGVKSRGDLIECLNWIQSEGHRKNFALMEYFSKSPAKLKEIRGRLADNPEGLQEFNTRVQFAGRFGKELGKKGILGWDYCRYIALCRWGVLCGYMTEKEAWTLIMPRARELQKTFISWSDLGMNYLTGRQFWSQGETLQSGQAFYDNYKKLLTDKESPWLAIPWNTDLSDSDR